MLKRIQQIHLYLGVLFAPLIMFFAFSGTLMVFNFQETPKDGSYKPPAWVSAIAAIHKSQRKAPGRGVPPSWPLKWFVAAMAAGLVVTMGLGVYMAFKYKRNPWLITGLIAAGFALPVLLLYAV